MLASPIDGCGTALHSILGLPAGAGFLKLSPLYARGFVALNQGVYECALRGQSFLMKFVSLKGCAMLKKGVVALFVVAAAGCSSGAPDSDQVKQALYDHYATAQGGADLQKALDQGVGVSDCKKSGEEYRCVIENKALGSKIPMFFAYDQAQKKWKFVKEDR